MGMNFFSTFDLFEQVTKNNPQMATCWKPVQHGKVKSAQFYELA